MEFLSDLFLGAAALGAAAYCLVLSRRLKALSSLEGGMGSAIAVLSSQVDGLARTLKSAQEAAGRSGESLSSQTQRAETMARRLELLMASLHDLPSEDPGQRAPSRWTGESAHRPSTRPAPAPEPAEDRIDAAPRARILRRRRDAGGQP
ncbi:MAG: hypothetical protein Kow0013_05130 [Pararhodobacter sp.]